MATVLTFRKPFFLVMNVVLQVGSVEESINDSVSVDLGINHSGAIGNNELVVAVQG